MKKHWKLTLLEDGFGGITFCQRDDVKYGVRPMPYYELDGDLELLEEIKNQLFQLGINSTIMKNKYFNSLQIHGVKNCVVLSEVLGIEDNWSNSLRDDFVKGKHLTEEGIKQLHIEFAGDKTMSFRDICIIIARAKEIRRKKKYIKPKLLPDYNPLYKNIKSFACMACGAPATKIYFTTKYPQSGNLLYFCKLHDP